MNSLTLIVISVLVNFIIASPSDKDWWQKTVFYQIYPRSFKDSNGDGIGDLNGITSKLEYLKETGIKAVWLSPIFASPMVDFGYDISDYYKIQPEYGNIDDFDALIDKAKLLDIKIILDFPESYKIIYDWRDLVDAWQDEHQTETKIIMTEAYANLTFTMRYYGTNKDNNLRLGAHLPFNFLLITDLNRDSSAPDFIHTINKWLTYMPNTLASNVITANWVMGNHDRSRVATRYGYEKIDVMNMLLLTLPGVAVTYQGEEIGMTDYSDISWADTKDPAALNTNPEVYKQYSRDFVRTPFQWDTTRYSGFTEGNSSSSWLPVNPNYRALNLKSQQEAEKSHWKLYQQLVQLRQHKTFLHGTFRAMPFGDSVIAYLREYPNSETFVILLNLGKQREIVDLSPFLTLPDQLIVEATGIRSTYAIGTTVIVKSIILDLHESLVLKTKLGDIQRGIVGIPMRIQTLIYQKLIGIELRDVVALSTTLLSILVIVKDSNGDGIGDIRGVIEKLDHLKEMGVQATWLSPIMKSPQADFGYDVSDFTDIDPIFGTLEDFDAMKQPDLNFRNPKVVQAMKDVLTFWLDRGASGFRVDAINHLMEVEDLRDEPLTGWTNDPNDYGYTHHYYTKDLDEMYEMVQEWRNLLDKYTAEHNTETKVIFTEAYTNQTFTTKFYNYGSHFPFNFGFIENLRDYSSAYDIRQMIDDWLALMPEGATANWVLGNHDKPRVGSRFGFERHDGMLAIEMTLPGVAVTYNGEEIGMLDHRGITWEETQDPAACNGPQEGFEYRSRDPQRTPFQWDDTKNGGFSSGDKTWLPMHPDYKINNLALQKTFNKSHISFYKDLSALRQTPLLKYGTFRTWIFGDKIYAQIREYQDDHIILVVNLSYEWSTIDITPAINVGDRVEIVTVNHRSSYNKGQILDPRNLQLQSYDALILRRI
uniref:CSON001904 protein n=1 Tax=Culicoides sonorensis TaxID=179676 RepID=A0A336LW94_CULSO